MPDATTPDAPTREPPETPEHRRIRLLLIEGIERPWMTVSLLVAMVSVHLAVGLVMFARGNTDVLGILVAGRGPRLLTRFGAMHAGRLELHHELWRLVSPIFLHGSGFHLLVNGLALVGLGRLCEAVYGPSRFLWLFIACGMGGALVSWLGGNELSVGASGAVFGLLGAGMVFGWRYRHDLPDDIGAIFRRKLAPWVVLNLLFGLSVGLFTPVVDNLAHVGGLVTGMVMAMILGNRVIDGEQTGWPLRALMLVVSLGLVAAAVVGVWGQWAALR